ncbi:VanZ family protein [Metabacillus iocasae]|uniref:Glycopeptide antibiotics resistance protein n=1 Tax=Priestia iocasae TaxID=2291674 RepID=A0ABS2QYC5_9BACI|nr:VanZ family protein [Metabacillus iocasae]MBM7703726.1 glycopeptide antibiotics resistance protein [Metabacillus iocasae]
MKKSFIVSVMVSQGLFLLFLPVFIQLFAYLHPMVLLVVWACMTLLVTYGVYAIRKDEIFLSYQIFLALVGIYTIGLLVLLFFRPSEQQYGSINLIPFTTIFFYFSGAVSPLVAFYNLAANLGLFVPYGLWGRRKERTVLQMILLSTLTICFIELTQHLTRRGSLDIDDLLLNVVGVLLGYFLYPLFNKVIHIT